jgi:vacuolar protein sorting-associated protein 54
VILGAGAMRSAGLKNITARHIALAIQTLGVVVAIIPHLCTAISNRLPTKQQVLLGGFDRLLRDYRDHQNELYFKLVNIMQERLVVHCKGLMVWVFMLMFRVLIGIRLIPRTFRRLKL